MKKNILALYGILTILPASGFASFELSLDRFLLENKESIETSGIEYFSTESSVIFCEDNETCNIQKSPNNTENIQSLLLSLFFDPDTLTKKAKKIIANTNTHIKNLKILELFLTAGTDSILQTIIIDLNKKPEHQVSLVDHNLKVHSHSIEHLYKELYKELSVKDNTRVVIISNEQLLCFTYQPSSKQEDISRHLKKVLAFSKKYQEQKSESSPAPQTTNSASTPEITAVAASVEPETPRTSYQLDHTSSELAVLVSQSEHTSQASERQVGIYTGTVECDSLIAILGILLEEAVPTSEYLQQISRTLDAIYKENPAQAQEEKVTKYHERIKNLFSRYMERELGHFYNELRQAYEQTGGSQYILRDFPEKTKIFVESLSGPLRDIIADVDIALTRASHSQIEFQQLKSKLNNYRLIGMEDQKNTLLTEFLHTLNVLSRNKKYITRLSNQFLDRLSSILHQSEPVYLEQETIKNTKQMLEAIEQNLGYQLVAASNASSEGINWLGRLCDAILDTRLPSLLDEHEAFELLKIPPTEWTYKEFIGFLKIASSCNSFRVIFDRDFQQSVINAILNSNGPNNQSQSPLFEKFKHYLEKDREGTLELNDLSMEDSYIALLAEKALGRRAINYKTARNSARLLAATIPTVRQAVVDHFFAPKLSIVNEIIFALMTKSIATIAIKQSPRDLKADIHLLDSSGGTVQSFTTPIMSDRGIPDEPFATTIQLLFGMEKIQQLYTNMANQFTLQYYNPPLMIKARFAQQAITDGSEQKTSLWETIKNKFRKN